MTASSSENSELKPGQLGVRGTVDSAFEPLAEYLTRVSDDAGYEAQLAVYHRGDLVADLVVGAWDSDDLLPVFSCGKGSIGAAIGLLVEKGHLSLDDGVARYWPEFGTAGKADITIAQLMSHQAGLPTVDGGFALSEMLEHDPLADRLAAQRPYWLPGSAFAYHALTIATLADELVRRVAGCTLAELFRDQVALPFEVDVHLGLPSELDHRVAHIQAPHPIQLDADIVVPEPDPLGIDVVPHDLPTVWEWVNTEPARRSGHAAVAALASARGLARLYSVLLGKTHSRLLSSRTIAAVTQLQVDGADLFSGEYFRYGTVFQLGDPSRLPYGGIRAFGHDGMGGSVGVADSFNDIALGYTVRRVAPEFRCDDHALHLMALARRASQHRS